MCNTPARATLAAALCLTAIAGDLKKPVLWRDPGPVEQLDLYAGPGGRSHIPAPPFTFIEEDQEGSNPKVKVRDAKGHVWVAKFGREVHSETFSGRIVWASGYYVEPVHFVRRGVIGGVHDLGRSRSRISPGGVFRDARFQIRDPEVRFSREYNWSWINNPFQGTREMAGLKILVMLLSNWDDKDARDFEAGPNTGVFDTRDALIYSFTDWGGTMGHWGMIGHRSTWKCRDYAGESSKLVRIENGRLYWGYQGRHPISEDVRPEHVAWILRYVGRLRDRQVRDALVASGATASEVECFSREFRRRVEMLRSVAGRAD